MSPLVILLLDEWRQALRQQKLFFVVILYLLVGLVSSRIGSFLDLFSRVALFGGLIGSDLPLFYSLPLLLSFVLLPFVIIIVSYDALSLELATKSVRLLAVRVPRKAIFFGKFLSLYVVFLVLNALLYGVLALDPKLSLVQFSGVFLFLALHALFFLSLTFWCSLYGKPSYALKLALTIAALLLVLPLFDLNFITYLSPLYYYEQLLPLLGQGGLVPGGAFVLTLLLCGFLLLKGYLTFERREL